MVAHRYGAPLRESVAATSLLTRADIEDLPARTLPEVLQSVPGIVFVERDGSGDLPMAIARGFFGGGETSYVLLTVDGVPVNDGRTGLVEWTQIPLSEIERIEVLRGSASVAYGDAALGAVVNVVTKGAGSAVGTEGGVTLGSWGGRGVHGSTSGALGKGRLRAAFDFNRDNGYRGHSESSRLASSLTQTWRGEDGSFTFGRLSFSRITNEEPGPLSPEALAEDRLQRHTAFGSDDRTRTVAELMAGANRTWTDDRSVQANLGLRAFEQERMRTLLLTPSFGDTQLHDERDLSAWARTQYAMPLAGFVLRVGGEAQAARYRTHYRDPSGAESLTEGEGSQVKWALHAGARRQLGSRLRLHAGVRYDAVLPHKEGTPAGGSPSFHQWSPRLALNLTYLDRASSAGNLFVTWTRAFKAPTLDQLYDIREIPSGVPDQTINLSNDGLKPQRSSAVEVGAYQQVPLGRPGRYAELSVSLYHQDLEDEIDFDIHTFKYGNIQRSRHRGIEASLRAVVSPRLELDHAATVTRATFRSSDNKGNQLKNIPGTAFISSIHLGVAEPLRITLTHRATGAVHLDDENTEKLEGSSLLDASVRWRIGAVEATLSGRNILDTQHESFGFLLFDPTRGANVPMVYPGAGRSVSVRLAVPAR